MAKYLIDGIEFNGQAEIKSYVKSVFLNNCPEATPKSPDWPFLTAFLSRHPWWHGKVPKPLVKVDIIPNGKSFDIKLVLEDGQINTISWNKCVTGKNRSDRTELTALYRESIAEQIKAFRVSIKDRWYCAECGTVDFKEAPHVDHVESFKSLVTRFEATKMDIDYFPKFHKLFATLQLLCKPCNERKGCK